MPKVVPELNNIVINPSIVKKKLDSLKINKSPGPDKLHPRLLKELSEVLSYPLSLIFRSPSIQARYHVNGNMQI